jgi:sugar transferase (PEP-CTERM/EpsH1 system associated)
VMDLIDIDSLKWAQYVEKAPPWTAWIYRHEARYLGAYEQRIAREFDRLVVVSHQERALFPGGAPENLSAIPNGVDLEWFSPREEAPQGSSPPTLVFTGVMDYWPNVDGITWFVDEVLPLIREKVPDVELLVVGSRPSPEVRRLAQRRGITVTGFVDDVRTYIQRASVCVVPLRIARGIQNKVLEAMSMGKAVVTTPQAYEGVRAKAGDDIVVAADPAAFAAAVVSLLGDAARAGRIGRSARLCVESNYSWARNLATLDAMLTGP